MYLGADRSVQTGNRFCRQASCQDSHHCPASDSPAFQVVATFSDMPDRFWTPGCGFNIFMLRLSTPHHLILLTLFPLLYLTDI
jgi:hypothetical protein